MGARLDFTGRAYESVGYGRRLHPLMKVPNESDLSIEIAGLYRDVCWTLPGVLNWKSRNFNGFWLSSTGLYRVYY
jgi:hypothetical protein